MKCWLLALLTLAAVACVPLPEPRDPFNATLEVQPGKEYQVIVFKPGGADALDVKLELYAIGVQVNAPKTCALENAGKIVCKFGTIKQGSTLNVPSLGAALTSRVLYKRANLETVFELRTN